MSFSVKINFNGEIRRFSVEDGSFAALQTSCRKFFGIPQEAGFQLTYADNEGDNITLASEMELSEALAVCRPKALVLSLSTKTTSPLAPVTAASPAVPAVAAAPKVPFSRPLRPQRLFAPTAVPVVAAVAAVSPAVPAAVDAPAPAAPIAAPAQPNSMPLPEWKAQRLALREKILQAKTEVREAVGRLNGLQKDARAQAEVLQQERFERMKAGKFRAEERLAQVLRKQQAQADKAPSRDFDARFLGYTACPLDTNVPARKPFNVGMRLRNNGANPWPAECQTVCLSRFDSAALAAPRVSVGRIVAPGEETELSLPMVAPSNEGQYEVFYRLGLPNGRKFGQRLRARVMVKTDESAPAASVAPQPTPATTDASVATVAAPPVVEEPSYPEELKQLADMGFGNVQLNLRLLRKFKGNLAIVVQRLANRQAAVAARLARKVEVAH